MAEWVKQLPPRPSAPVDKQTFQTELLRVITGSDYVFGQLMQDETFLRHLWECDDLRQYYFPDEYAKRLESIAQPLMTVDELMVGLRRFRHQEMVRIIWRDITQQASLTDTLTDLSNLADACLIAVLNCLSPMLQEEWGAPCDAGGNPQALQIITMGKLGGQELNLSSDIDLIFAFPEEGQTVGGRKTISNQLFFTRLAQQLIQVLNKVTPQGFVFRVDTRLRPYGDSGPLVVQFSALKHYFLHSARIWERYAFIKARILGGDPQNNERLGKLIEEFTYQSASDTQIMQTLKSIKEKICQQVLLHAMQQNIKLGSGGIREIEFIVQVFQLIYGAEDPALREKNLLKTLELLRDRLYLKPAVAEGLLKAYQFLRLVENRLQCFADKQTHNLPTNPHHAARIAYCLNYVSWPALFSQIEHYRHFVSKYFAKLTEQSFAEISISKAKALRNIKFQQQLLLKQELQTWQEQEHDTDYFESPAWKYFTEQLINQLLIYPEQQAIFQRILKLLTIILQRKLAVLDELDRFLPKLLQITIMSTWLTDMLVENPELLIEALVNNQFWLPNSIESLRKALADYLVAHDIHQPDDLFTLLIKFKQDIVMRVALADVLHILSVMQVSDRLTDLACVILETILDESWRHLCAEYGRPPSQTGQVDETNFVIIGYGKLGSIELGYASDLDLVFLHDVDEQSLTNGAQPISGAQFYQRLAKRILEALTTQTSKGRLYAIDTRLKPMGESGALVNSFNAFAHYQRQNAWTWEHQALVRARAITGDKGLTQRFYALREEILSLPRDIQQLRQDILTMRERMRVQHTAKVKEGYFHLKHGAGGITDIEFLAQYVVLAWSHRQPLLMMFPDNIRIFETCESAGLLSRKTVDELCNTYRDLREFYHHLALQNKSGQVSDSRFLEQRTAIQRIWHFLLQTKIE